MIYPETKVENAFKTLFEELQAAGNLAGVAICVGFDTAKVETLPMISILALDSQAEIKAGTATGNWNVNVHISAVTDYFDSDREDHQAVESEMRDLLMRSDLNAKLNATNATTFIRTLPISCQRHLEQENENTLRHTTQTMEIYCCGGKL